MLHDEEHPVCCRVKKVADCAGYLRAMSDTGDVLLDSLSLFRHGKSSSELGSVMILDPAFGNSLRKVTVSRTVKTSHEQ
jgi:hypothetical protein